MFFFLLKFEGHATNGAILVSSIVCRRQLNFPQTHHNVGLTFVLVHVNRKLLVAVDLFLSRMLFHNRG